MTSSLCVVFVFLRPMAHPITNWREREGEGGGGGGERGRKGLWCGGNMFSAV